MGYGDYGEYGVRIKSELIIFVVLIKIQSYLTARSLSKSNVHVYTNVAWLAKSEVKC